MSIDLNIYNSWTNDQKNKNYTIFGKKITLQNAKMLSDIPTIFHKLFKKGPNSKKIAEMAFK